MSSNPSTPPPSIRPPDPTPSSRASAPRSSRWPARLSWPVPGFARFPSSLRPVALRSEMPPSAGAPEPNDPSAAPPVSRRVRRRAVGGAVTAALVLAVGFGAHHGEANARTAQVETTIVSGAPGLRAAQDGFHQRWHGSSVVVTLDPSLDKLAPGTKDAVRAAFDTWNATGASVPAVTFENATESGTLARDGVARVLAAPITIPGHTEDLAVTVSYSDQETGQILEADILFNTNYPYDTIASVAGCTTDYDVASVATHEAGHFFGLGEDEQDDTTTMYIRTAKCDVHKRELSQSDSQTMSELYQEPSPATSGCGAHVAPLRRGGAPISGAVIFGAAMALGLRARRRRVRS